MCICDCDGKSISKKMTTWLALGTAAGVGVGRGVVSVGFGALLEDGGESPRRALHAPRETCTSPWRDARRGLQGLGLRACHKPFQCESGALRKQTAPVPLSNEEHDTGHSTNDHQKMRPCRQGSICAICVCTYGIKGENIRCAHQIPMKL